MRHNTQVELMNKMLQEKTVTPRTYLNNKLELEIWVKEEKDDLQLTKTEF